MYEHVFHLHPVAYTRMQAEELENIMKEKPFSMLGGVSICIHDWLCHL